MLHVSLDKYGFFAVTASLTTLQDIIAVVEEENGIWQNRFDDGMDYFRCFKVIPISVWFLSTDMVPPASG
jgi:hypothetical protein